MGRAGIRGDRIEPGTLTVRRIRNNGTRELSNQEISGPVSDMPAGRSDHPEQDKRNVRFPLFACRDLTAGGFFSRLA